MNKVNYQKKLDEITEKIEREGEAKTLLLHSCCAPCSSYVLKYLSDYFKITLLYFNPNIFPKEEYEKRVSEQRRLIEELPVKYPVDFIEGRYEPGDYFNAVKGLEGEPEGGRRCLVCYEMRLREAAEYAIRGGFDYFTTTLSISPLKNADAINEIGERLGREYGVKHLPSDFKKKDGYKQSVELSKEYNLYRQNFCGCVYSQREVEK
ncbi:MAG: epoxyqueuosine reductase QueH [Butyrivibrio sp.]